MDICVSRYLPHDRPETGLVATVSVEFGGLIRVNGIRLIRAKATGRHFLYFPGDKHRHVYPVSQAARFKIENAVFAAYLEHECARLRPAPDAPASSPVPAAV